MIIGHEKIFNKFNNDIINNNLLHSYIFSGANGIGKKKAAIELCKKIMCKNDSDITLFENDNHPDFNIIVPDEKDSIKIEKIREMIEDISIKPIKSEYKIYVIDDSDKITIQAQNALLKTLEEPPHYVIIMLITSKYYALLDTIRSRCQKIDFEKLSNEEIIKYIKENNTSFDISNEILLKLVDGSIGNIENIIEDKERINSVIEFIDGINDLKIEKVFEFSKFLNSNKENIFEILEYMINVFNYKSMQSINDKWHNKKYINCIMYIEQTKKYINGNINFEICIDELLINIWEEYND